MLAEFTKRNGSETSECFLIILRCQDSSETQAEPPRDPETRCRV